MPDWPAPLLTLGALGAALGAVLPTATAANLQISPVMIHFQAGQGASGITLQNLGQQPVYGQVRVFLWDQQNGEDVLTPTQDVVASPPIIQVGAESSQTIRLVRRGAAQPGEQSYRVLIDEIPSAGTGGANSGVDFRLRYSVPVFMAPATPAAPQLSWQFYREGGKPDGDWMLKLSNTGQLHAQLGATTVSNTAGREYALSQGLMGYALAGRVRIWRLQVAKDAQLGGELSIRSQVNAQPVMVRSAAQEP